MTNKATNRPLPTLAGAVLSPSTIFFGKYVKAGKVVKVMELYDPVAHLRLNQYITGLLVGKGNKWVATMVH
jgi:hypothetical protein